MLYRGFKLDNTLAALGDGSSSADSDRIEAEYLLPGPSQQVLFELGKPEREAGIQLLDAMRVTCEALASGATTQGASASSFASLQLLGCLRSVHATLLDLDSTLDQQQPSDLPLSADAAGAPPHVLAECRHWLQAVQACVLQMQRQLTAAAAGQGGCGDRAPHGADAGCADDAAAGLRQLCGTGLASWTRALAAFDAGGSGSSACGSASASLSAHSTSSAWGSGSGSSPAASPRWRPLAAPPGAVAVAALRVGFSRRVCPAPRMPYSGHWAGKISM